MGTLEKVRGITELPIFPLPVVLVPGMILPLHIFEPRYRLMLRYCLQGNRLFGLSYHAGAEVGVLVVPEPDSIGCAAEILTSNQLPDGRSDILTVGSCRYTIRSYASKDPYLLAKLDFFEDEPSDQEQFAELAETVSSLFLRFARAVEMLRDLPLSLPKLPEDHERLSFVIASIVFSKPEDLIRTLETRSTEERLEFLQFHLESIVEDYEQRAQSHINMKGNGRKRDKNLTN
jgi:Lon protease-like protein